MTGFVAVISKDRARPVPDTEIARLADAYELLHEAGERHAAAAGDYARVVKFDTATADPGASAPDFSKAVATYLRGGV